MNNLILICIHNKRVTIKGVTLLSYNNKSIKVLKGLDAVRERPGMYIGSTNVEGLHHLLAEVIDNSIDEHLAGFATDVWVELLKDGSVTIEDNGRGIPVDIHEEEGVPTLRLIMTTLHAGGKFDNDSYKTSGGLHGVGSAVVNALSKELDAKVYQNGYVYTDKYINGGQPNNELVAGELPREKSAKNKTGTYIRFLPDDEIFETIKWDAQNIKRRLHEKAYLNSGLKIHFTDRRKKQPKTITYYEEDGLLQFLKSFQKDKKSLTEPFLIKGRSDGIEVEVALMHVQSVHERIYSFVNGISTTQGGTHITGLRSGFTRLINSYIRDLDLHKETFTGKEIRSGLLAIVSIKHPDPQFEGQTKGKLGSTDARAAVENVMTTEGRDEYNMRVMTIKVIIEHAKRMQKIHKKEKALHKSFDSKETRLQINGKLANCSSRKCEEKELYIVEGDSAGGTAKQGRNRRTQAILPLKGKVLNVERASLKRALNNEEIASFYGALGAGVGENFDIDKIKFNKIIILSDADVDGSHIRTLLLTMFWRLSPDLILDGHVYRGVPPLFKVTTASTEQYVYNDEEMERLQKDARVNIKSIQRYKGLGEMDAEQLWNTTLDPETRVLERISIDNIELADETTDLLMGSKAAPRREFIYRYDNRFN